MLGNIKALLIVLKKQNIDFVQHDENFIEVNYKNRKLFFINCRVPFNDHAKSTLFVDKYFTYVLLKDNVKMPKTYFYLDPFVEKKFHRYRKFLSYDEIVADIKSKFSLPFVIKPNRLSRKKNFFLIEENSQIILALQRIFNHKSKNYDYGLICQDYINIKDEYRVVVIANEIRLIYKKWKFIKITDINIIFDIQKFVENITKIVQLDFVGIDLAYDIYGNIFLIEINSAPDFTPYIKHNSIEDIVDIYSFAFEKFVF